MMVPGIVFDFMTVIGRVMLFMDTLNIFYTIMRWLKLPPIHHKLKRHSFRRSSIPYKSNYDEI